MRLTSSNRERERKREIPIINPCMHMAAHTHSVSHTITTSKSRLDCYCTLFTCTMNALFCAPVYGSTCPVSDGGGGNMGDQNRMTWCENVKIIIINENPEEASSINRSIVGTTLVYLLYCIAATYKRTPSPDTGWKVWQALDVWEVLGEGCRRLSPATRHICRGPRHQSLVRCKNHSTGTHQSQTVE